MRPDRILRLCAEHEARGGVSQDAHCAEPLYHPMAEGKYLSTIALLRQGGALGRADYDARVAEALERLERSRLGSRAAGACWGLGFAYKEAGAEEPYLITTSIVADGLLDVGDFRCESLLRDALRWLVAYRWTSEVQRDGRTLRLPWFSPNTPLVVTNVVAQWAHVLRRAFQSGYSPSDVPPDVVWWLVRSRQEPVGWPYAEGSGRIDLLHQAYILNGLGTFLESAELELLGAQALAPFADEGRWLDKLDLMDMQEGLAAWQRSSKCSLVAVGRQWLVRHLTEARPWSYGEALLALARLTEISPRPETWRTLARRIRTLVLRRLPWWFNPGEGDTEVRLRDRMHVAHGLAALWRAEVRTQAAAASSMA